MKLVILFLLAVFAHAPLQAQAADRDMISDAAHCIVHGDRNWLEQPLPKIAVIVSAVMDTTSYPKQPHMILLVHTGHLSGQAFSLRVDDSAGKRVLSIQNNADFKIIGGNVSFTSAPLGGEWTQKHFARSIARAMKNRLHTIPLENLTNEPSGLECTSYVSANP